VRPPPPGLAFSLLPPPPSLAAAGFFYFAAGLCGLASSAACDRGSPALARSTMGLLSPPPHVLPPPGRCRRRASGPPPQQCRVSPACCRRAAALLKTSFCRRLCCRCRLLVPPPLLGWGECHAEPRYFPAAPSDSLRPLPEDKEQRLALVKLCLAAGVIISLLGAVAAFALVRAASTSPPASVG
jgi:hypothetical protein